MKKLYGRTVSEGVALGPVHVVGQGHLRIRREKIENAEAELERVRLAGEQAARELRELCHKLQGEPGGDGAAIFRAYEILLKDAQLWNEVEAIIRRDLVNGEYAVMVAAKELAGKLLSVEDAYIRSRAEDVRDIADRFLRCMGCEVNPGDDPQMPVILAAESLMPSELMRLDRRKILGIVTREGSVDSHTAILARMMRIPALIGVQIASEELIPGAEVLVDGFENAFIIEPTEELQAEARRSMERELQASSLLQKWKGQADVTRSGRNLRILANIGSLSDLESALENDAAGIGLFRSEFLYMDREDLPGEEEQFLLYRQAAERLGGKLFTVRTLDVGADKHIPGLDLTAERNPALGCRGIRISLAYPDVLKTQLRALYRAAVYGRIAVLYPMITSVEEVESIHRLRAEVEAELAAEKIPWAALEEGVMIETPAAAMVSRELAEMVDFLSIGTNDLTQYTLAVDRQESGLGAYYNPRHPAVLRLIRHVAGNAGEAGKRVCICGELGADPGLFETFLDWGIGEISVAPWAVLKLRSILCSLP